MQCVWMKGRLGENKKILEGMQGEVCLAVCVKDAKGQCVCDWE